MRLKPNDSPVMELGEIRNCAFKLSGAVGVNEINTASVSCDTLTVGNTSASGTTASCLITADKVGTHMVKCSATLSSAETIIGVVRVKVIDSTQCNSSVRDYE